MLCRRLMQEVITFAVGITSRITIGVYSVPHVCREFENRPYSLGPYVSVLTITKLCILSYVSLFFLGNTQK